ncbi:MAG: tetratricopeptide repeat protein [Armatimonadetes bacterium]|nr:tetratricopeptide repeat protein [Armatimonadota bacterium]
MRRRAAWAAWVLLPALGTLLVSGCSDRARRQFRIAEALRLQNKPDLAAARYEQLVQKHPNHPVAAAAHFELASLYRIYLADPQKALVHYQTIADRHPRSTYADNALQWIASMGRAAKNVQLIRTAVNRLEAEHPESRSGCARARIQLALALLEAGRPETKSVCQSILEKYPDQPNQCAQAQLILGRAFEKIDKNDEAAVKQWESVRKNFPETTSAVDAYQRIGWFYYARGGSPKGKPATAPLPKRRIDGVPAFAHEGGGVQAVTLDALAVLLKHRGTSADLNTLMAVSGTAFQFVYDPQNRSLGSAVFADNPLQASASAYGFSSLESSSSTAEEAMLSLCQAVDRGKPTMVPHTDGDWVVVIGYDRGSKQFVYVRPGGGERTQGFEEFAGRWKAATDQAGGALDSFYQFALGPRKTEATSADLVRAASRRGVALLLQRPAIFGSPGGTAGYDALVKDLQAHATETVPEDAADLASWADGPLMTLRDSRTAAAQFLEQRAGELPGAMSSHARTAAALYRSLAAKLAQLHDGFPRPPEGAQPGVPQPGYRDAALAAVRMAGEALDTDRKAVDQLSSLAAE